MKGTAEERELFGVKVPRGSGHPEAELRALREGSALLPAPWERLCLVGGRERTEFLHAMLTQDVNGLAPGRCRPAALADRKGHCLADLWVLNLDDRLYLRVRCDRLPVVLDTFERHRITEDVTWTVAGDLENYLLLGPGAASLALKLGIEVVPGKAEGGPLSALGLTGTWMRIRETSDPELLLSVSSEGAASLASRILALPDAPGPIGWESFNYRRIESGAAWVGLEGAEDRLVPEILAEDRISYTKGCYLGQETLSRLHHLGQLNWRISVIRVESANMPEPGMDLLDGEGTRVGWIAGAARHPAAGTAALAYLHRRFRESPGPLRMAGGGSAVLAPSVP